MHREGVRYDVSKSDNIRLSAYRILFCSDNLDDLRDLLLYLILKNKKRLKMRRIKKMFEERDAMGYVGSCMESLFNGMGSCIESIWVVCGK